MLVRGWFLEWKADEVIFKNANFRTPVLGKWNGSVYMAKGYVSHEILEAACYSGSENTNMLDLYHGRLNHINKDHLIKS